MQTVYPHLNENHNRWKNYIYLIEPNLSTVQSDFMPNTLSFIVQRHQHIDHFMQEDFLVDTSTLFFRIKMTNDCFNSQQYKIQISTPTNKTNQWKKRKCYVGSDVNIHREEALEFIIINENTLYTVPSLLELKKNMTYRMTAVFNCPVPDERHEFLLISEVLAANDTILNV